MAADTKPKTPAPPEKSPACTANAELPLATIFTLVLWLTCLTVGAVGFVLPYTRPKVVCYCEEPVEAQKLEVELTAEEIKLAELPPPDAALPVPPDALAPPPLPQASAPVVAVAPASAAVAFAVPVLNPTRIAPTAKSASYIVPKATPAPAAAPAAKAITFGQGEGKQTAPEYPRQAVREGQEGTVTVRLVVDADGSVRSAEASVPSPWPLLNDSAVRTVLRRWRFQPGPLRVYEVAIRFELKK